MGVPALTLLVSLFLHLQNLLLNEAQQLCGVGHPQYEWPQLHRHSLGSQRLLRNALWVAEERAGIPVTCSTLNRKTKLQSLSFPTRRRHRTCTKAAWRAELESQPREPPGLGAPAFSYFSGWRSPISLIFSCRTVR